MDYGGTAEVGVVGPEGVIGSLQLLGPALAPIRCFMQLAENALRISLSDLRQSSKLDRALVPLPGMGDGGASVDGDDSKE